MSQGSNLSNVLLIIAGIMLGLPCSYLCWCFLLVGSTGLSRLQSIVLACLFLASIAVHHWLSKDRTANHVANQFLKLF